MRAGAVLQAKANPDLQSDNGATALMSATYFGHLSSVLLLLQHSANPDLQDSKGITAP